MSTEESYQALAPALVPELLVTDVRASLEFWCGLCGFKIDYQRESEGFAYISREGSRGIHGVRAELMLEQRGIGRDWVTGELERPFGRGINLQISVSDVRPIVDALRAADVALFMEPEAKGYRLGETCSARGARVEQFLVTDPDGYLIRFQASLDS